MRPVNLVLSLLGFILAATVFTVHFPTRNVALLLVASILAILQFVLTAGALVLPLAVTPNQAQNPPAVQGFCEAQAFLINVLGIATYGGCLCLAYELNVRTSAQTVLKTHHAEAKRRHILYFVLALGVPVVMIAVMLGLRVSRAYYVHDAFCDNSVRKIPFIFIFVLSLLLYTAFGSFYTIVSVTNY
ncbi:hypothetical protein HK102_004694, partial [Quaeritorhiza haematococci]